VVTVVPPSVVPVVPVVLEEPAATAVVVTAEPVAQAAITARPAPPINLIAERLLSSRRSSLLGSSM
jgi:hypothetical protein